ncbi:MAG: aspartate carbamoyltransferase [Candidatus Moranbacteria bacterium]|nr:aspartate carbamoyltransferase [Candidatus Moranbacteria bacterium]
MKNLTQISQLNRFQIESLIELALKIKKEPEKYSNKLQRKIIALLFFEASTRTRLSFEAAVNRLGGKTIGFSQPGSSSYGKKGESLTDTIRVVNQYSDLIVMRHPKSGAAKLAKKVSKVPIINGGDGANEHPTQTLLDLMTIYQIRKKIDNLKIAMVGDLKFGRTVRSLSKALTNFQNVEITYVSCKDLAMKDDIKEAVKKAGLKFKQTQDLKQAFQKADIVYMTRIQSDRFKDKKKARKYQGQFVVDNLLLKNAKKDLKILHPLPRNDEIAQEVDDTAYAFYFEQAGNGMYMRMALLLKIFDL